MQNGTRYEFTQPASGIPHKNYRDPQNNRSMNLMYDRRVVRGNTYAAPILPPSQQAEAERIQKEHERQQRRKEAQRMSLRNQQDRPPSTPEPVEGRQHMDVQTDKYLEELTDKVEENDEGTQTEDFMDRPPTPRFIPQKSGSDQGTQILPGDLFDFDMEVEPMLEVIVGRTLEKAALEILEEDDLKRIEEHKENFRQIRDAELAEVQRLEAEEKRRMIEKERRMEQEKERVKREQELRSKILTRAHAKSILDKVQTSVFVKLAQDNFFEDPMKRHVADEFIPWLEKEIETNASNRIVARDLLEDMLRSASESIEQTYKDGKLAAEQREKEEQERLEAEKKAAEEAALAAAAAENEETED
eukprot:TRINITY_DN776030_c0_g1_i1.p1 TRINITY_DN776030_c0_g1~~TRINITY_DN776030_c0_g1_i1.p1  ORF type:complete len:368 (-),score=129.97 TRINITY_DN776030_c0_g1_i1:161-1237(-)